MGKQREIRELDAGTISFFVQQRVHDDAVAHVLMRLISDSGHEWIIVIGRKRIAERFWALVTDKLGDRAEEIGAGEYRIYEHDGHSHLAYALDHYVDEAIRQSTGLGREGSFLVTVMNPDPGVWGDDPQELLFPEYVVVPTPFPARLQERFNGRKYAKLDTAEFLDFIGAELVLISR